MDRRARTCTLASASRRVPTENSIGPVLRASRGYEQLTVSLATMGSRRVHASTARLHVERGCGKRSRDVGQAPGIRDSAALVPGR